jgi:hypothetical protein
MIHLIRSWMSKLVLVLMGNHQHQLFVSTTPSFLPAHEPHLASLLVSECLGPTRRGLDALAAATTFGSTFDES